VRFIRTRLNRRFYRVLTAVYRRVFPTPAARRLQPSELGRVLIVQHHGLGDLIVSSPALGILHDVAPHAEIDVLASPRNMAMLAADDRIARVFVYDQRLLTFARLLPRLRARRYDAIYSLIPNRGLREGLFASLVAHRTTHKISVFRPKRYVGLFTHVIRSSPCRPHRSEQIAHVVWTSLALPREAPFPAAHRMHIEIDDRARGAVDQFLSGKQLREFTVVNLWANVPTLSWPVDSCVAVVRELLRRDVTHSIVLTPPPRRLAEAERVRTLCDSERVHTFPPTPRLLNLVALLELARLVITPDTGVVHIASVCGTPTVALYLGPTNPSGCWSPFGVPHRMVDLTYATTTSPDAVDRIVTAVESLLGENSLTSSFVASYA
jgi:heptosyltransferase-3